MKHTIIIVVLTLLLRPVLPVVGYVINYDYIVKELCENKEKPELHCNGKCQLMKELAKASEKENPISQKKSQVMETEVLFFQELEVNSSDLQAFPASVAVQSEYKNLYSYLNQSSFYHPPAVI